MALLKEQFGQTDKLTDAHTQALLNLLYLLQLTLFLNCVPLLTQLRDTHQSSLSALRASRTHTGKLLVCIINSKIQVEICKNLARDHQNAKSIVATASFLTGIKQEHSYNSDNTRKLTYVYCKGSHSPKCCLHCG